MMRLIFGGAATVAFLVGGATAHAGPLAPTHYKLATVADRSILRVADGWHTRLANQARYLNRCHNDTFMWCRQTRIKVFGRTGNRAATAIRNQVYVTSFQDRTPCVVRVGNAMERAADKAWTVGFIVHEYYGVTRKYKAWMRAYNVATKRVVLAAKACQENLKAAS